MEDKRAVGKEKETLAEAYLKEQGYVILEKNFYSRFGEIDLVARDGAYLAFVEVKYRKTIKSGYALEAVTQKKIKKIYYTAQYYLYQNQIPSDTPCRFDVVAIQGQKIQLIKNAFGGL